jgi:hypothetical protein
MINNRLGFALKLKDDGNYQLIIEYFISWYSCIVYYNTSYIRRYYNV